ncbi:restriction endonuclease subunit S [Aquisediminimonas profunda]|uniref:restriction endonuclease subunit S n=1 Tax=Aquisediminimonas profunda TaxID=1550733 RepID=UPI001C633070|nr:restriction endonuclease subunit S [Aquisediminimonas profunda]
MSHFPLAPLSELAEVNPKTKLAKGNDHPFVAMENVSPGRRYVKAQGHRSLAGGARFEPGDTLLARITPCLENGKIAQYDPCGKAGFGSTEFIVLRAKPAVADPGFVHYLAVSEDVRAPAIASMSGASGRQRADAKVVAHALVPAPPLDTQRRIASILGAYDDLIEVNRRRVALLEEMARGLFEEWFVRFRFPGHEDVPMVEMAEGVLPEGWRTMPLSAVASINARSLRPAQAPKTIGYIDIASVAPGEVQNVSWMLFSDAPGRARRMVADGSILWSNVRPNRRSFAVLIDPQMHTIASTGFTVIDALSVPFSYLYHWVTTDAFVGYLVGHATGAAYPAVTSATFDRALVVVPSGQVLADFNRFAEPTLRLVEKIRRTSRSLAASRDLLLPRLISGQLSVEVAEQQLEEAA